jgi:hypothetical protein
VNPLLLLPRLRRLAGENKLFTGALAVGAFLRLLAVLGYPGALWFSGDSYVYVGAALRPQPNLSKTTGYSLFLRLLLPFHSFTLVTIVQHLMGLAIAVLIYLLLRRNQVSKTWSTIAALPMLLDGYIIEDEHLIMAESLFTFLLMVAMVMLLWRPDRLRWQLAAVAGLLVGYAAVVRTEGDVMLAVLPLFLLLRGRAWRSGRGWAVAAVFAVASLVPVGAYASWFHERTGHFDVTMSTGYFLWGRVSSFANCAVIKPTGREALVCPMQPIIDRTPPGTYIWDPQVEVHKNLKATGGPVTPANNKLLTDFAIHAVEAQPLNYASTVFFDTLLSFGYPRIGYPSGFTTYYYSFHLNYGGKLLLPPKSKAWISPLTPADSAYADWMRYGHQPPGAVRKIFAAPLALYQRIVFTYGPLLAVIFLVGLGGVVGVRRRGWRLRSLRLRWAPRGTTMLPWVSAVALLVTPIAVADFDYRYLIPVIPFACLAAGLAFAPRPAAQRPPAGDSPSAPPATIESTVPDTVS